VGQSVNQYVGVFQNTLTPISDMGAMDQVHQFVNGLLPPIAAKVWEKHPENLIQAIDAAVSVEAMSNFGRAALPSNYRGGSSSSPVANPDAMDINNIEGDDAAQGDSAAGAAPLMNAVLEKMTAMEARLNAMSARSGSSLGFGQGGQRAAGTGRSPRDRIDGLDAATIKKLQSEGKCFRCKKTGHMKNECPERPKNA
jgi:hypothetical protein